MGWIGVDLDGTLAEYHGFIAPTTIGPPVRRMVERVQQLLHNGVEVRIFTARIDPEGLRKYRERTGDHNATVEVVKAAIVEWSRAHIGRELLVTDRKDLDLIRIWDDQAVQVVRNTGDLIG